MPVPRSAWPRMVVSCQGRPPGPATFSPFSRLAIARGEAPPANAANMRFTIAASRPKAARAARGAIGIVSQNSPALRLGVVAAELDLIPYRGVPLQIGGVAGVDRGAHANSLLHFDLSDQSDSISDSITVPWRRAASIISA
jgi:hypothetical protein